MHDSLNRAIFILSMLLIFLTSLIGNFESIDDYLFDHGVNFAMEQCGYLALVALAAYFGASMTRAQVRDVTEHEHTTVNLIPEQLDADSAARDTKPRKMRDDSVFIVDRTEGEGDAVETVDGQTVIYRLREHADSLRGESGMDGTDWTDVFENMELAADVIEIAIDDVKSFAEAKDEPQWDQLDQAIERVRQIVIDHHKPIDEASSMVVKCAVEVIAAARGHAAKREVDGKRIETLLDEAMDRLTPLAYIHNDSDVPATDDGG